MNEEWIPEWPAEFIDEEDFEDYRHIHLPVKQNPHPKPERETRNTQGHHSKKYGEKLEKLLEERHGEEFNFAIPNFLQDPGHDAVIFVDTGEGLEEKQIQVKGCFHSKKSNPDINPRISIPYKTHNGNGDNYLYHLGVYTFTEDIENMELLGETVLGYDAFDTMLEYVKNESPQGTNIQDSSKRKNHALIEWDLAFRYAEKVHELYSDHGIDQTNRDILYKNIREAAQEYEETDQRQISKKR